MRIIPEETMALIIDLQEKLVPAMPDVPKLLKNTKALIEGLKIAGVPMIITEQYPRGLGATVKEIMEVALDTPVMEKLEFSCYDNEQIRQAIVASGKKNIMVCGIEAHICVMQTVIDLKSAGYNVIFVEDCVQSRKIHDQKMGVKRAEFEGACITTCEGILFELVRKAGTPQFKQLSALVKNL